MKNKMRIHIKKRAKLILFFILFLALVLSIFYLVPTIFSTTVEYNSNSTIGGNDTSTDKTKDQTKQEEKVIVPEVIVPVTHIETPEVVKAIYISSWVAGTSKYMNDLIKLVDTTEINTMVIDIKDSSGHLSFKIPDDYIDSIGSAENRIPKIRELINKLHEKNIYIIGRISVFQDPYLAKFKPEWSIKKESDGSVWKDFKGMSFLDPTNTSVHKYILNIALGSYNQGFDEINFDYIRYPSDGNISNINYNIKEGETRSDNIKKFFKYISTNIKKDNNIPISVDLFGLTTEASTDMGIGQVWEDALPYFDFIAPMVYASHYASGYSGYKNPSDYPYEVVHKAILGAIDKTKAVNESIDKIRPWLQDFNLGAIYTKDMVRAQIKAVNDLGITSWMLWSPSNKYTKDALKLENSS